MMNTSSKGENPNSRTTRMTRAGNDANSVPFDKLSVDETALAKHIISPLANPNFPRIREPLDSTTSTVNSSDDVNTSSDEEKETKPKQTTNAQSTNSATGLKIADLPDKLPKKPIQPISSPSATERNERAFGSPKPIELSDRVQSFGSVKSPDPEAKHINRIFRRSGSGDRSTSEEDSYYEVYDSNSAEGDDSSGEYYTDVESSGGWTSSLGQSTDHEPMTRHMSDHEPRMHSTATRIAANTGKGSKSSLGSFSSEPVSSRSGRVGPDGKLHISPGHTKNLLTNKNGAIPFVNNLSRGQDPDADFEDTSSFVAEDLDPTPDETEYDSRYPSTRMSSTNERGSSSTGARAIENSSGSEYDAYSSRDSSDSIASPPPSVPSSASTQKPALEQLYSQFPSNRLLVFMVVMIALVAIGIIASLTFYLLERTQLDPICPPDDLCCNDPTCITFDDDDNGGIGFLDPLDPNDKELLDLFESVAGEAVRSEFTSAGMAAKWMIDEDPGRYLKSRSAEGWIQRYLLAYTYYATTLNRSTSWLSCNPAKDEGEVEEDDKDACMFAFATELPGGRIVYDLVPSHRWLSAVDECQWGGVACGTTVVDEINVGKATPGSDIPIKSTMKRLAVTSIVLTDQYLKGSIVPELTKLPMLQTLDLSHNELQGTIDSSFNSLETLRLQYNAIQGSIPENFFDDKSVMKELNIGSNLMTGTIPEDISLASRMTELYLFNNKFTGSIPTLGNMPLVNFHGQENEFSGIMPFDYGPWPDTLREWWVYDNKLTGSLSEHLGFLENLEDFRASKNDLTGVIPDSIKNLQRLYRFEVQSNSLTGTVPEGIGELPLLRDVRLQFNKLKGIVPTSLCFMESMEVLEADCLVLTTMEEPQTDCYCCTTCCNAVFGSCQQY